MSGLPSRGEEAPINGIDVREQGNSLRVATNTPHLVSLGTGRLSTAVTLHPIKQGRVTIGSDPTCDIYVAGTGVCAQHCRVENSHNVVTLYPVNGCTLVDGLLIDKPTRLSQGSMLTIGRSNYLRFNHPEEAKLMKSVLPDAHLSMAPIQFTPNQEACNPPPGFTQILPPEPQGYQPEVHQPKHKDSALSALDRELEITLKDISRRKPPVAPRKPYKDLDQISDSNSDQESLRSFGNDKPKNNIMAKVSKFEYYAKQQKIGRSQFYTNEDFSPKVFSSNSLTVNTPAKDVLGGKNAPTNYKNAPKVILNENNVIDARNCAYQNVMIKNKISKIDDIAKNFDENTNLKKVNNVPNEKQLNVTTEIHNANPKSKKVEEKLSDDFQNLSRTCVNENYEPFVPRKTASHFLPNKLFNQYSNECNLSSSDYNTPLIQDNSNEQTYGKINEVIRRKVEHHQPSPSFDRNPQFTYSDSNTNAMYSSSPVHSSPMYSTSSPMERSLQAEDMRLQAYTERLNDEREQEAESARLEEILSMCAEYERQITCGTPSTPTEKRSQNKIITNGSLPRSGGLNNTNFIQTSDGFFKFDTSQNRLQNASMSKSLPLQRNLSNYENLDQQSLSSTAFDSQGTPQLTIRNRSNYENVGSMDEIGIPITDYSSPIMVRKINSPIDMVNSPLSSPYENVFYKSNMKPRSPNTSSPRTRIKTTFAHKNVTPQYFIFPTPPPVEDNSKTFPNVNQNNVKNDSSVIENEGINLVAKETNTIVESPKELTVKTELVEVHVQNNSKCFGIEKQLSLNEEIPMIDDSDLTNDLESRTSQPTPEPRNDNELKFKPESPLAYQEHKIETPKRDEIESQYTFESPKSETDASIGHTETSKIEMQSLNSETEVLNDIAQKVPNFEDVRRELMADIPELDEFEKDINNSEREIHKFADEFNSLTYEGKGPAELKLNYDTLKGSRKQLLTEIHKLKCKMSEIRSQEDDILKELEMEKALIKGEYDSELAILNLEQRKKQQLLDKANKVEQEMKECQQRQGERQREMRDRVEIATLKVERIEKDLKNSIATEDELQNARDILDNETKLFEDLEFQHLEEESEMLAYREDLQNEIISLSKKIESQKCRILTLKSEANNNLTSALEETRALQADYLKLLNQVETLTTTVQGYEKQLKDITLQLNAYQIESPYELPSIGSPEGRDSLSSDSDDQDVTNFKAHQMKLNDKFNSIDRMSQSMIVELGEKRQLSDLIDSVTMNVDDEVSKAQSDERSDESPSKGSTSSKKGFWERNFDSLSRLKNKKPKSPPKVDVMSQSLNENMFFNNDNIESDFGLQKFNSLKMPKTKKLKLNGVQAPVKSSSSSKIPTFAALGKMIKKDSINKKKEENNENNRYVKNSKSFNTENKYKIKQSSPEKVQDVSDNERFSFADSLEGEIEGSPTDITPNLTHKTSNGSHINSSKTPSKLSENSQNGKILHRKSCGDEPGVFSVAGDFTISDTGKIPSQDDIDRISAVTLKSPLVGNEADKNSMGRKTLDSLMEIERNRLIMLEKEGCQVIENERERMSELKRRVQNETTRLWESERDANRRTRECDIDGDLDDGTTVVTSEVKDSGSADASATGYVDKDSFGAVTSSIEELQGKEDGDAGGSVRPVSDTSDLSHDTTVLCTSSGRTRTPYFARTDLQRPLTRYLPIDTEDFDLRQHIESAGHQVNLCPHVTINTTSCRGYLHKLGAKFHTWSKRWFVFDRDSKTFIYYSDKSERKPRGGAYFQVIEEVYLDHGNSSRSPNPQTTFVVKTRQRRYYLMSPSGEAARIWIDVIFTGAQGYMEY